MKKSFFLLLLVMQSVIQNHAQVIVREVSHRLTQVDFGYQLLNVYFNVEPASPGFEQSTSGFKHTEEDRKQYVNWLKEEITSLLEQFVSLVNSR